jgi:prolyl-tRNA synthetase
MKISKLLMPTLRETPADAEVISHILMSRAGMISKVAAGIYNYLPFGYRVIRKVENIIREEMNRAGAQEVLMPFAVPAELWQESGRWQKYGKELLRFKDRKDADFCLGPTHEEVITTIAKQFINSYKQLPQNLYQIQGKFRDETRPRFGLMRGREFIMKDAYSFHDTEESLDQEYKKMYATYCRIFERCGLKYKVVEADSGNIGGSVSQEFMVLAENGEDALLSCNLCSYSSNVEAAKSKIEKAIEPKTSEKIKEVHTPGQKGIDDVAAFLKASPRQMIKTLVFYTKKDDAEAYVVVLIRGDRQVNEIKLKNYLGVDVVLPAEDAAVHKVMGVEPGYCGPVGIKQRIIADFEIEQITDGITGANKADYHIIHVVPGRDFELKEVADLRTAVAGDTCPKCAGKLESIHGIEVGHIFKLGTKYSTAMNATFLDRDGKPKPFIMGCYGIGVGRTAASAIEQHFDQNGIVWPMALAPYHCVVIPANAADPQQIAAAEKIYQGLLDKDIEVLLDDRDERIGVKLKDQELIGIPTRIVVGKSLAEGKIEFRLRSEKDNQMVAVDAAVDHALQAIRSKL